MARQALKALVEDYRYDYIETGSLDEPLEYAKLYLDGTMQMWVDAEDSLEI